MTDPYLRLTQLEQAISAGEEFMAPLVVQRAREDLRLSRTRMDVGDDFVVAALVGGTGSGKSTLFNKLTELNFAHVSEARPTTHELMACTWGGDSAELLNVLNVPPHLRFHHESLLTIGNERHEALVLLDTPDYDSINLQNSAKAANLLPMVDVAIWVLDPQKYTEMSVYQTMVALGRRRSQADAGRDRHTLIVVMNRMDTVPSEERQALLNDAKAKLDDLGFSDVPLIATSALYGDGVDELDKVLSEVSADRQLWKSTSQAQLDSVAVMLSSQIGDSEINPHDGYMTQIAQSAAQASGVNAVAEAVRSGKGEKTKKAEKVTLAPQAPAPTLCTALRDMWVAHAIQGLPSQWQAALEQAIPSAESVRRRIADALSSVSVPAPKPIRAWGRILAGVALCLIGIALAVADFLLPNSLWGRYVALSVGVLCVILGVVVTVLGWVFARRRGAEAAKKAADDYEYEVTRVLTAQLEELLIPRVETIVKRHKAARTLLMES